MKRLLLTAILWAVALTGAASILPYSRYANEWMFEYDAPAQMLADAINHGTDNPLARFAPGHQDVIFTENGRLTCIGRWDGNSVENGAVLHAPLMATAKPVHYLRYDIEYDLSSNQNENGALFGVYFREAGGGTVAGIVLGADTGSLQADAAHAGRRLAKVTQSARLDESGTLVTIAELDLSAGTLKVWYGNEVADQFAYEIPHAVYPVDISSIDELVFHATGTFRAGTSGGYVGTDNIRHTKGVVPGGAAWAEITEALHDPLLPPVLDVTMRDDLHGGMAVGETNRIVVVIGNKGGQASLNTYSQLHVPQGMSLISANNAPALLPARGFVTNLFEVVAGEDGTYRLTAEAYSDQAEPASACIDVIVGKKLELDHVTIDEISGGEIPGEIEPGERIKITVFTRNSGGLPIHDVTNSLHAANWFDISAVTETTYPLIDRGAIVATEYMVDISPDTPAGNYPFLVKNSSGDRVWADTVEIEIFVRHPHMDVYKADNDNALNLPTSWSPSVIPGQTDRVVMDERVKTPLVTDIGMDQSWRGIALVSNTVDWAITGKGTLSIGSSGIDMAEALGDLLVYSRVHLSSTQAWHIAENRTLDIAGIMTGTNTQPLIKNGKGTLVVTNRANATLRGGFRVNEGLLKIANQNVLGQGNLEISNATLSTAGPASLTNQVFLSGVVTVENDHSMTLSGMVDGSGSLVKRGDGDLILASESHFAGGVSIMSGGVEIRNSHSLGSGPIKMHNGSRLHAAPGALSLSSVLRNSIEVLGQVTFETLSNDNSGLMVISGALRGPGKITLEGFEFHLLGENRTQGGMDLNFVNWLWLNKGALGEGPLTTQRTSLLRTIAPMTIANRIFMNHEFRLHNLNHDVALTGEMSGSGMLSLIDSDAGSILITGENRGRTGQSILRRPVIILGNANALGSGGVLLEPQSTSFEIRINQELKGPQAISNNWVINRTFRDLNTGELYPVRFSLDHDLELTGSITQREGTASLPVFKNGRGALILSGHVNILGPITVRDGGLTINNIVDCERIVMKSGTILSGKGSVGVVRLLSGSTLRLSEKMLFQQAPEIGSEAKIVLNMRHPDAHGALAGSGIDALELRGTLILDFTDSTAAIGDEFQILRDWALLMDSGTEVVVRNLPATRTIDASRLFVDGSVTVAGQVAPAPPPIEPGEMVKEANRDDLNLATSWVGGIVPGAQSVARLDSRVWSPLTTLLGANTHWRGISMVSNVVDWTIDGRETLTIGAGGVDMSRAGADLQIAPRLIAGSSQQWDVAGGRSLTVAGEVDSGEHVDIVKVGEGRLIFPSGAFRQIQGNLVVSNGTLAVSGGYDRLDELRIEAGPPPVGSGRIHFSAGTTLTTADTSAGLTNPITIGAGVLLINSGQDMLLGGPISGQGGLVYSGSGLLRLAGSNNHSGGVAVESGSTLEFTHSRAFGTGVITLRDGAELRGWLPSEINLPTDRTVNNKIFLDEGRATFKNLSDASDQFIQFRGNISGPGRLRVNLQSGRRDINLLGDNSFEGGLEIFGQGGNVILHGAGPGSLGKGDIICLGPHAHLGFNREGGRVENRIDLTSGSLNFVNQPNTTVEFAGEIFGSGSLSLINRPGIVHLSGDNHRWSGGINGIGSHNSRNVSKRLIVDHPRALGTGPVVFGGQSRLENYVQIHIRAPIKTYNDLFAAHSGPEKNRNDLLIIDQNSVFGKLDGVPAHQGLDKRGLGRMTLTAQGNYPSPFNVLAGSLKLETGAGFPGRMTVSPAAGLIADDARTGPVRIRSGGAIEVKGGGLRVEGGALTLEGDAQMTLRPSDPATALLIGDGDRDLTLSGTLLIDFSEISPAAGDFVELFGGWNRMINNGVTILAAGLDDFMTLDPSTLFSNGRVQVVDGGRTSSQELKIRVTSGGTSSASVQVHNPESVIRYFSLKPGTEWPSWLLAKPTTARTAVGSGAQVSVTVTANATGLPAGMHRFMLPVVWEHGVSDLILVTVQVEGPSLTVAPSLTLPVVENTTGEGTVDLTNNGTLPVSYRIRRVLAEHGIYTQPAADAPWVPVSPTAQTRITSFPSGRSAPRAIGFGFPFFGTTETEVSVGVDGTLWFGDKPAIRVFSNQLSYQSGTSKVTAVAEADRFIVTWDSMVQSDDQAQQTFQAVLYRDGRIDLRYHTIVADSTWRNALIGLHGPTQWFPAQVPEPLQGRTIRFKRDADTARISIPQISGTVAAGASKTVTVSGDASGLSAGDSRTAIFAVDYDGGLTGTAGEVQVTMDVVAPPSPDPVADELAPPAGTVTQPPVVVLNPPQRTDSGRTLTWSVDGEYGGMQPSGTTVYRIETTTNLLSGSWEDLISVTNKLEYTDEQPMDGPVIFYRIIKE